MLNITVKKLLNSLPKDEPVYYRHNPGNAGDSLIATGAFKLFKECNLNVKMVDPDNFDATDKIVIYAGGGNLVGIYPEAREFIYNHHENAKHLILLPHTVKENEDLLKILGENVTLFAREEVTYEYLKIHAARVNVYIDHDLALHLNAQEILKKPSISFFNALVLKIIYKVMSDARSTQIPSVTKMFYNSIFEAKYILNRGGGTLNAFRDDVEKTATHIPSDNADLSMIYEYGTHSQNVTFYTTQRMMRYISNFSIVRTNRLHVCVAAALLDKEVEFYQNSYFKCRAVFEYSLKSRFPNIKWMGE